MVKLLDMCHLWVASPYLSFCTSYRIYWSIWSCYYTRRNHTTISINHLVKLKIQPKRVGLPEPLLGGLILSLDPPKPPPRPPNLEKPPLLGDDLTPPPPPQSPPANLPGPWGAAELSDVRMTRMMITVLMIMMTSSLLCYCCQYSVWRSTR